MVKYSVFAYLLQKRQINAIINMNAECGTEIVMLDNVKIYICDDNPCFNDEISEHIKRGLEGVSNFEISTFDNGDDLIGYGRL